MRWLLPRCLYAELFIFKYNQHKSMNENRCKQQNVANSIRFGEKPHNKAGVLRRTSNGFSKNPNSNDNTICTVNNVATLYFCDGFVSWGSKSQWRFGFRHSIHYSCDTNLIRFDLRRANSKRKTKQQMRFIWDVERVCKHSTNPMIIIIVRTVPYNGIQYSYTPPPSLRTYTSSTCWKNNR